MSGVKGLHVNQFSMVFIVMNMYSFLTRLTEIWFQVVGYLNLLANSIDNFTHGLAVAGSFVVSTKVG